MGITTGLRRELKARFFLYASARGFAVDQRLQPGSTVFRRRVGDRIEIFALQWHKYGKPRFAVHFGTCEADGLHANGTRFSAEDTLPTWCVDVGTLQSRKGFARDSWFRQDSTLLQRLRGHPPSRAASEVVDELMELFPEIERYWQSGEVGCHLRMWQR